eukprot:TRINITY_DN11003_c0_g1_i2.p1 TRINITY_DN11003_c0_g1~~TRINITY_DN11003_c0_g1_i2.p1  ORF type:complete len:315 (+),score=57.55 TRINITY_DN11003_c0_g1_i2:52-996(+)
MNSGDKRVPMATWPAERSAADGLSEADLPRMVREWRQGMPHYGCTGHRASRGCMVGVVAVLIILTYVAFVILNNNHSAGSIVCMVLFHLLLSCVIVSYVQIVAMNPGEVPMFWHDIVSETAPESYALCRKCNRYKPPRSHFDSVTQRLVLNMDHFCPWVGNTVGFYNRKFFILFTFYTSLTCLFVTVCFLSVYHDQTFPFFAAISDSVDVTPLAPGEEPAETGPTQSTGSKVMFRIVFAVNSLFAFILVFFTVFHMKMALKNETTIEDYSTAQKYDVGRRSNWNQVCAAFCFLPMNSGRSRGFFAKYMPVQTLR